MDIKAEKVEIIAQLIKIQDEKLLHAIRDLIAFGMQYQESPDEGDFWDELTAEQRERIETSINQLETGEHADHEDVMAAMRKKYQS